MRQYIGVLLLLVLPLTVHAQYNGQQPLQKSFEQARFFYQPSAVETWTIGEFTAGSPGLFEDPLNAIALNPSLLDGERIDRHYFYLDFRSLHENKESGFARIYPTYYDASRTSSIRYPYHGYNTSPELAPLLSFAYLTKPLEQIPWRIGATYQLIYSNDDYYRIPHDIYQQSFAETSARTASGDVSVPVTDRYSGSDNMSHMGHFLNLYTSYQITDILGVGAKIGYTGFNREGEVGSSNLWGNSGLDNESYRSTFEDRSQQYQHLDLNLGVTLQLSDATEIGLNGGALLIQTEQDLNQNNEYNHYRGDTTTAEYNFHDSWDMTTQRWDHTGQTINYGASLKQDLSETIQLLTFYEGYYSDLDLDLTSDIASESYSIYRRVYDDSDTYYSENDSEVTDQRTGDGTQTNINHQVAAHLRFTFNEDNRLLVGINLEQNRLTYETREQVSAFDESYRYYERTGSNPYENEYYNLRDAEKELRWDYDSRRNQIDVPVIYTRNMSESFELSFGVQRTLSDVRNEETILDVFDRRELVKNGQSEIKEDFAERYRYPNEQLSDVSTSAIFGMSVTPDLPFETEVFLSPGVRNASFYGNDREYFFRWQIVFTLKN